MPALLCSVGGSPEPILHTLRTLRPACVAYVCSVGSRANAEAIQAQLDFSPVADYLELTTHEELGPCYAELRAWLPGWLASQTLAPDDVTVDYTGGTKTMSAALVLAATEVFSNFSYVGGAQRDQAGTGIVLSGHERIHYQANPWRELAVRELDHAATLWATQQYEAVAALLRRAKGQVPREQRPAFDRIIDLARALSNRLDLQLPKAAQALRKLADKLVNQPPPSSASTEKSHTVLLDFCQRAAVRFAGSAALQGPATDPRAQLRELLDNALLTARLGRHDDAAARLYRALELFGQNELSRLTDGAFYLGRLKTETIPPALADFSLFAVTNGLEAAQRGMALENIYRALAHLKHPAGQRAVTDFDGPVSLKTPWRQATQRRNQSILAHGLQPVGQEGFETLAALVADYTGEDTSQVDIEAPVFNAAWFA